MLTIALVKGKISKEPATTGKRCQAVHIHNRKRPTQSAYMHNQLEVIAAPRKAVTYLYLMNVVNLVGPP